MNAVQLRILDSFPEPDFTSLRTAAFADFGEESKMLAAVQADEATRRLETLSSEDQHPRRLHVGAFLEDRLIGWSYSRGENTELHTIHSGVDLAFRGRGIYADMVKMTIAFADTNGFSKIISRHVPSNNAVIIPKLRLGFMVSAFEYSEIYGPVIHLTYLVSAKRRELHRSRSRPIVPSVKID